MNFVQDLKSQDKECDWLDLGNMTISQLGTNRTFESAHCVREMVLQNQTGTLSNRNTVNVLVKGLDHVSACLPTKASSRKQRGTAAGL